jgi:hypothetical protein
MGLSRGLWPLHTMGNGPMSESSWGGLWLGFIGLCVLLMTVTFLITVRQIHRLLQQISSILPTCRQAFEDTHQTLSQARQMLARTNRVMMQAEGVVTQVCTVTSQMVEHFVFWKGKAQAFLAGRFGNGVSRTSRRLHR